MIKVLTKILLTCTLFTTDVYSDVKLPALIGNGMVLQRDTNIPVWGWASPNEKVTVEFNDVIYTSNTGEDGKWRINLNPQKAGGSYTMKIKGNNEIIINDILIGEVWICAGQSNMQLPISFVQEKYKKEIETSHNSNIRMYFVVRNSSLTPIDTLGTEKWQSANPTSILKYTATGYFFARQFYEKHKIPVGIIQACWGGTPIQAWISKTGFNAFSDYLSQINTFDAQKEIEIQKQAVTIKNNWFLNIQKDEKVRPESLTDIKQNTVDNWKDIKVPVLFKNVDFTNYAGVTWLRKEAYLSDSVAGKKAILFLGNIINIDSTYVNGKFVGHSADRYKLRKYNIPENILRSGRNIIAIKVISIGESPAGGMVANKPYQLIIGKEIFNLEQKWQYKQISKGEPMPALPSKQSQPTVLYNGMVAPLIPYAIRGVLWYQGESNVSNPTEYRELFPALIKDWRKQWSQGEFPFLYVQLSNYGFVRNRPTESKWAELREAQTKALLLPNTGMVVSHDLGDWNDVHPLNKKDIGKRLELVAEKVAYGNTEIISNGPIYYSKTIKGNKIILSFREVGSGLTTKNGTNKLQHFAIAGNDGKFIWAEAKIIDKNKVMVWNNSMKFPVVAVRYAWADNPELGNLYNKEGLPASSFRIDF